MSATTGSGGLALFEAYPGLMDRLPWVPLGRYPTPLERVKLALPDGGMREILVKRDDLTADLYGGNKVRKLEFLLASARAAGARRLITAGATGSHHALATAIYGRRLGFPVTLVLFPQRVTAPVCDILRLDHAHGAELRWTSRMEGVPFATLRARLAHAGERPFVIPPGGSDPTGTLGYVNGGFELAAQLEAKGDRPSAVYLAAGTLGTAAGLALGLTLGGMAVPVRAVRITSRLVANERAMRALIRATAARLRAADVPADAGAAGALVELRHGQIGEGYGRETGAARLASDVFLAAGLPLDATYTAKAAADLLAAPEGDSTPLFLHTLSATAPLATAHGTGPEELPAPFSTYVLGRPS
jgi:1-aminocyclopropane-1-carboxylate deaminase/D-cysteine desulfhydrase-like pyridoxal-dependent ACC family enzyme